MHNHSHTPNSKAKDLKGSIKKLLSYCRPYLIIGIIALVLSLLSSILSLIGPNKLSDLTDIITKGLMTTIDIDGVKEIAIFLIIIYSLSAIFAYVQGFIMATISQKFSKRLRSEISVKINKLPLKYFDSTSYGDVLSRVTNDVDTIGQTLNQSLGSLVSAITLFFGSMVMMFYTNGIMAITAIVASFIGFALMIMILSKSQKYFVMQQSELGRINGHIEEIYSGHNVVKVYNGVIDATNKFDEINEKLYTSARKSQFLSGLMPPLMGFIGNFGYVAVCIVGSILVIKGNITFGVIVAFMIYIRLFTNPITQMAQAANTLQSTAAASERVFTFLEEEEMTKEQTKKALKTSKVKGNIEFTDVHFGYDEDKTIINNFSAKVSSGQKIAIVGPTGAGKTTMVNLLMKFYEINSGDIKIDGTSIKNLTRENIHDLFIMVLQDTWVFNGTIKENIIYNTLNVSDEQIKEACKVVGLDYYIRTLPKG